jgi:oligopeptide transport system ATP-binding protein
VTEANNNGIDAEAGTPLVRVRDLQVHFPLTQGLLFQRTVGHVKAVDGVSFDIRRGETFGLVGESGCGKTTVARALLKLLVPTGGSIEFDGKDIANLDAQGLQFFRRRVQSVFQDPFSSLNPRMRVRDIVGEPLVIHLSLRGQALQTRVDELLTLCGLSPAFAERFPHEMSGGQRQRVGIARALALEPDLIVCDEAVSALDVSIQAQIVNLLARLQAELGLTYLFIGHDLSVVRHLCDRVGVMYLGKLVEETSAQTLFDNPAHPYTRALIDAVPVPDPQVERARQYKPLEGEIPSPLSPPPGCVFHPRCPSAVSACSASKPTLTELDPGHLVACPVVAPTAH